MTQEEITHQSNEIFPILHYLHDHGEFDNVIKDIKSKLNKMAKKKKVAKPAVKPNDLAPCPQGYHRDGNGVCVPDVGGA